MDSLDDFGLLTLAAVADLLHCSKAHVSNVIAGRVSGCAPIPAVSLGRRKLVRREALRSWVEHNEMAVVRATIPVSPARGAAKRA
jgi:hypothetical protein